MPAGTSAEDVIDGAGMVRVTTSFTTNARGHVMNAPSALILSVLASSMNWSRCASRPRIKSGICRRSRWDRRRSSKKSEIAMRCRSEEHTSELQSHSDLHSFPTRRSSDLLVALRVAPTDKERYLQAEPLGPPSLFKKIRDRHAMLDEVFFCGHWYPSSSTR